MGRVSLCAHQRRSWRLPPRSGRSCSLPAAAARVPRAPPRPRAAHLPPRALAAPPAPPTDWATATSAAAGGGMSALVAAAKKEGHLNVITLPANWANYGTIMKAFTAKYGIKINDENPDGSSQDELNAIKQLKGQSTAPDVVDVGGSFAAHRPDGRRLGPVRGRDLEQHPGRGQGRERRLLRRLRRLHRHRLRLLQGEDPADLVQVAAHRRLQEPGRDRRQPDPDRVRVRRRRTRRPWPTAARWPTSPPASPTSRT